METSCEESTVKFIRKYHPVLWRICRYMITWWHQLGRLRQCWYGQERAGLCRVCRKPHPWPGPVWVPGNLEPATFLSKLAVFFGGTNLWTARDKNNRWRKHRTWESVWIKVWKIGFDLQKYAKKGAHWPETKAGSGQLKSLAQSGRASNTFSTLGNCSARIPAQVAATALSAELNYWQIWGQVHGYCESIRSICNNHWKWPHRSIPLIKDIAERHDRFLQAWSPEFPVSPVDPVEPLSRGFTKLQVRLIALFMVKCALTWHSDVIQV